MNAQNAESLMISVSQLVRMRSEAMLKMDGMLKKVSLIDQRMEDHRKEIETLSLKECIQVLPEANRPKVIDFPDRYNIGFRPGAA